MFPGRHGGVGGQHCPPTAWFPLHRGCLACRAGVGLLLIEKHEFAFKGVLWRAPAPHVCGVQLCLGGFSLQRPSGGEALARSEDADARFPLCHPTASSGCPSPGPPVTDHTVYSAENTSGELQPLHHLDLRSCLVTIPLPPSPVPPSGPSTQLRYDTVLNGHLLKCGLDEKGKPIHQHIISLSTRLAR